MNEADAYSGRVRRAGMGCVCVMDVIVVCVISSATVLDEVVDAFFWNEMRESEGCVSEKHEISVASNERLDDELRVKRDPPRVCAVIVFATLLLVSGTNEESEREREESTERKRMERYVQDEGGKEISREEIVTVPVIVMSEGSCVCDVH